MLSNFVINVKRILCFNDAIYYNLVVCVLMQHGHANSLKLVSIVYTSGLAAHMLNLARDTTISLDNILI